MPRFYKDKQIKKCADCPLLVKDTIKVIDINDKEQECELFYCPPIKEKYGWNEVEGSWKPNREFCRLTNEVSLDFELTSGQFAGFTVRKVLELAPRYISKLIERGVFIVK